MRGSRRERGASPLVGQHAFFPLQSSCLCQPQHPTQAAAELLQLPQVCEALAAAGMDEPTPAPTPTASGISGSGFHPGEPGQAPDTARARLLSPSALQRLTSLGSKLSAAEDLLHGPAAARAGQAGEPGATEQGAAPLKQGGEEEEVTSSAATSTTVAAAADSSEVRSSAEEHAGDSASTAGSPSAAQAQACP